MKRENIKLDSESAKSVKTKLGAILTASDEDMLRRIEVDPTGAADVAEKS